MLLNAYTGLGALAMQEWSNGGTPRLEQYWTDALATQYEVRRHNIKLAQSENNPAIRFSRYAGDAQVARDSAQIPANNSYIDYTDYFYDFEGRTRHSYTRVNDYNAGTNDYVQSASYYDGNGRLAQFERHLGDMQQASLSDDPRAVVESYRYDALGRRVLTHALRATNCAVAGCESTVQRFVWDADQLLYEIRARGGTAAPIRTTWSRTTSWTATGSMAPSRPTGEWATRTRAGSTGRSPDDEPFMDNHFHGTHVASTIASNSISVAPVAPHVTLIAVKMLSMVGSGTGSFEGVAAGIRHAAGPANADVINMSLGANVEVNEEGVPALLEMMARVIKWAEKQGTIVISAAGNDNINLDAGTVVSTPCEQSTVCVSATGPLMQQNFDQPATYTNYGISAIEVAAPGGNASDTEEYVNQDLIIGARSRRASSGTLVVCRTSTEGVAYFYAYAAGTSMATLHVAGLAALIKSYNPTISVNGLRSKILHSSDDVGVKGRDVYSNWGRINAAAGLGI